MQRIIFSNIILLNDVIDSILTYLISVSSTINILILYSIYISQRNQSKLTEQKEKN